MAARRGCARQRLGRRVASTRRPRGDGLRDPGRRAPRPRGLRVRDWPEGSPRVLVSDAWLANAGDGAIALATQARVRRLAPDAAVLHSAYQADLVGDRYPELALVPPLAGLTG